MKTVGDIKWGDTFRHAGVEYRAVYVQNFGSEVSVTAEAVSSRRVYVLSLPSKKAV